MKRQTLLRYVQLIALMFSIHSASAQPGTLGFDYVLDSDADTSFHFNPATGTITFPIVLEGGHVTKRKITYTFNGKYFIRTNNR